MRLTALLDLDFSHIATFEDEFLSSLGADICQLPLPRELGGALALRMLSLKVLQTHYPRRRTRYNGQVLKHGTTPIMLEELGDLVRLEASQHFRSFLALGPDSTVEALQRGCSEEQ